MAWPGPSDSRRSSFRWGLQLVQRVGAVHHRSRSRWQGCGRAKQTMLPSALKCIACGLKITGLSKLSACGLGDAFISTTTLTPAEFFGLYTEQDLAEARSSGGEPEWEEDFNER